MAITFPQDFKVAALIGKVNGVSEFLMAARSTNIQISEPPITVGFGANILQPFAAAAESWEIVSSSANDTAAGTGARTVQITYLDGSYVQQSVTVTLNGTTPVAIAANCFRHQASTVMTAGSGRFNAGTLTIRVAGAGATRGLVAIGQSASRQGSFTVPVGYNLCIQHIGMVVGRTTGPGVSAVIAAYHYDFAGVRRVNLDFTLSEPGLPFEQAAAQIFHERDTLKYQVTSVSANSVDVSVLTNGLLINNSQIANWPIT